MENVISGDQANRTPDIDHLVLALDRVNRTYQGARYEEAGRMLPALIRSIETAVRTCPRRDSIAVSRLRSEVYQAATMVLSRVGSADLAWTAADRAVTAAEHAGAAILAAMSAYRLAHVFTRRRQSTQARDLTTSAASALGRARRKDDPAVRLSVVGSLQLADALAAAAEFDREAASRALEQAEQTADRLGEDRNDHWTAFGPTNVRIHRISAAVAFGDAAAAVETGEGLDLHRLPAGLAGRRSQVSLDLARAYAQQRHDAAAVNMLLEAERTAPQLVRFSWSASTVRPMACSCCCCAGRVVPETLSTRPKHRMFPGRADQIAHARDFTRRSLGACPVLDEAVLLVSELATNAVEHTATGDVGNFHVTIHQDETWLLIAIKDDGSNNTPAVQTADALAEDGRGLGLVELIAYRWGHCGNEGGRTVWFELCWDYGYTLDELRKL